MRQQQRELQTLRVSNIMHAELLWIELCTDIIGRTKEATIKSGKKNAGISRQRVELEGT